MSADVRLGSDDVALISGPAVSNPECLIWQGVSKDMHINFLSFNFA